MNTPNTIEVEGLLNYAEESAIATFQANLFHLKSQLAFANSQIEMRQIIIQYKVAPIQSSNLNNYLL